MDGPRNGLIGYESMQDAIDFGYQAIARELGAPVAPVGIAWRAVKTQAPSLELWMNDGSHPSTAGSYLAACVFYTVLFRQSPEGLSFPAALSMGQARMLQAVAAETVLSNPQEWNLPQAWKTRSHVNRDSASRGSSSVQRENH